MKKYFAALVLVLALSGAAFAEVKIDLDQHDCLICKETFFCFKGDPLDRIPVEDQPKKVYMLSDRSKHMKDCKNNFKMHRFVKIGTRNVGMDFIRSNMNKIVVIDGGGTLNQKLYGWQCMLCGKKFYSFYGINLNIRDWDVQPDHIKALKNGNGIQQCSKRSYGYFGHVFKLTEEGPITSYGFAKSNILDNVYYVR